MHTDTEGAIAIQRRGDKKLSATRPIYSAANWTLSQPSAHHSLFYSLSSSLLPFPSLSTMNFFCHEPQELPFISRGQGLAVLNRSGSRSSGDRGKEALQGSREMPRDAAEPAPHARTHPPPLSPPARAAAAVANRKGRGKKYIKKAREGVALSAAGTLHHRLPLWKGGRGVDGGREVLLVAALSLSLLSSFQCMHKSKFNICDLVTVKYPQWLEPDL